MGGRLGSGAGIAEAAGPQELAAGVGAAGARVEPGARTDVPELSGGLLLDDVSERVGDRRGVSAGGRVAAAVPAAGAVRDDHSREHRRAALSGAAGDAAGPDTEDVSGRSGERSEVAGRGRADQAQREWELGETIR